MREITKGSTNVPSYFMMRLAATNLAATGLAPATFEMQYTRELTASAAAAAGIVGTGGATNHVDNKVFELDATNSPGLYMVCFPDAAFATGVDQVTLNVTYDATVFTEAQNVQLVAFDPFDAVRMGMTALPNAAADAAGGLPISDAGGLSLDTQLANTHEVTAARMGALTDWINGGRLDLIIDAIDTNAARLTAVRAAVLTDWINGGRLDLLLDAIPTTPMRGTDGVDTAPMRGTDGVDTAAMRGTDSAATAAALAVVDGNVDRLNLGVITGVAQTGTLSTTQATTDLTGFLDGELVGRPIIFTGGTASGQASDITGYSAASGLVTFTAIPTAPANLDPFKIV